jgi:large conductance mechanosensitive channel
MQQKNMLKEFKEFVFRRNTVDLAIGVVVGSTFRDVTTAIVKDLLTPLIAALFGAPDFARLSFAINGSRFMYGDFINTVISLLLVFVAIFFFVVRPMNIMISRAPATKKCTECLSDIPIEAKRCSACGEPVV